MTRFRVGLIVLAVLVTFTLLVVAWVMKKPGGADRAALPEPVSYAKPSPDGSRVFVAFGSAEHEARLKDDATLAFAADVRAKYPAPGLYPAGSSTPLASGPAWEAYTPDENVHLTADGGTAVRIEGDWWKTKAYPAGKRLSAEAEAAQLSAPAVTFLFADGREPRTYRLDELIDTPGELSHSPEHILWPAGAVLNTRTNQFHLFTQDSTKITFDAATGDIVHKGKNGLGNPITQTVIWVVIGLTLLVAAAIGWFALRSRGRAERRQATTPLPSTDA